MELRYVAVYYIARTNFNLQMCNIFCIEKCSACSFNYLSIIIVYKHAFLKKTGSVINIPRKLYLNTVSQ